MKVLAVSFALSLATVGCMGSIPGSNDPGTGKTPSTGGPNMPPPPGEGMPPTNPPSVAVGNCNEGTLAKPRAWRLTHTQVRNSLRDSIGYAINVDNFPAEGRIDASNSRNGYANRSDEMKITDLHADAYFKASEALAEDVAAKASTYGLACAVTGLDSGDCLGKFVRSFGAKMWRRPLTDPEAESLTTLYKTSAGHGEGPAAGLKTVVQAMFLSPRFLYRSEVGHSSKAGEVTYLTDHELATSLSYTLWDSSPDAELMQLAGEGKLRNRETLLAQAKRMLAQKDKSGEALHHFIEQWLHTEDLVHKEKDLATFSTATPEMAKDVAEGNRRFFDKVLFGGDKSFKTLFTADTAFVNQRTASLYGLEGVTGDELVEKKLDPTQRKGLLTQAAFMWGHSNNNGTHPVERGRYFREEILCEGVPDPPPSVIIAPEFGDSSLSARERLSLHLKESACAACHQLIDGFGLAMENYDGIGRFRTEEMVTKDGKPLAKPIDASGTMMLPSNPDEKIAFSNFVEMVTKLADKPDVYTCFASQYIDYSGGRKPGDVNACERNLITEDFVKSGYNVDTLVLGVIGSPSFMARKN